MFVRINTNRTTHLHTLDDLGVTRGSSAVISLNEFTYQQGAEIYGEKVPSCSQIPPLNFRVCRGRLCSKEGEGTWKLELGQRCSNGGPENGCFAEPAMQSGRQRRQNACSE